MKKILLSIMAIALTVSAVSATAYALFSSTATIQGMTMTSGNADLLIARDIAANQTFGTNFGPSISFGDTLNSYLFGNMYPGYENWGYFRLDNNSASKIPLALTAQLMSAQSGDWDALKDKIQIKITKEDGTDVTSWYTLAQWNSSARSLGSLAIDQTLAYRIYVRVLSNTGDEIANKNLTGIQFNVVGTQILTP